MTQETDPELIKWLEDNTQEAVRDGPADVLGESQVSGQPGQSIRNAIRDNILMPLVWANLIKRPKRDEG